MSWIRKSNVDCQVVHLVSWGLFDRCCHNYGPVPPVEYRCRGSAESVCDSAAFPDERESAAGQLKRSVCQDKPQSHTPTLRYKYSPSLPDEPMRPREDNAAANSTCIRDDYPLISRGAKLLSPPTSVRRWLRP
jgi:hypothetical protein